jgi:hypothetical protein
MLVGFINNFIKASNAFKPNTDQFIDFLKCMKAMGLYDEGSQLNIANV